MQSNETEKFLSYFKPCIIPQEGGVASGFKHAEAEEYKIRLFVCKGKHVVHVKEASSCLSDYNIRSMSFVLVVSCFLCDWTGPFCSVLSQS